MAEDDELFKVMLNLKIDREGYELILCKDGKEAKQLLDSEIPDLLVLDIMMPYYSGIELIEYTRCTLDSQVPIIVISAASDDENVMQAFELGANDFLKKPFSPAELLARIAKEIN
ncbi:MAG: response regulator transcription factor [Flavobacteriaceae bacterium]